MLHLTQEKEIAVTSTEGRALVFSTALLAPKTSRATIGVSLMNLKPKYRVQCAVPLESSTIKDVARYRARSIPVAGALLKETDRGEEQMSLM